MTLAATMEQRIGEVELLIYHTVGQFIKTRGGNYIDLLGVAQVGFQSACETWKDDHGSKFSSWCRQRMWGRMMDLQKNEARKNKKREPLGEPTSKSHFNLRRFAWELSTDAQDVLHLLFNPGDELEDQIEEDGGEPGDVRVNLCRQLRRDGWSLERIHQSFREIKEALS